MTEETWTLIVLAASIGTGSALFHTFATPWAMWLDILPIALFQVAFLWLYGRNVLKMSRGMTLGLIGSVIGLSFAAMPLHQPLNGSLFYVPGVLTLFGIGLSVLRSGHEEPGLVIAAAVVFALAVVTRSLDWTVPFRCGTHFLWHILNGITIGLVMRAWILHHAARCPRPRFNHPALSMRARNCLHRSSSHDLEGM